MKVKFTACDWKPDQSIYSSKDFLSTNSDSYGWIGGYINSDLKILIPFTITSKLIFKYATFHSSPIKLDPNLIENDELTFLEKSITLLKNCKIDFCAQTPSYTLFKLAPQDAITIDFGSYRIDLNKSEDDLWKSVNGKHRNVILNAKKKGVTIICGLPSDTYPIYKLFDETMKRSNMIFMSKVKFDDFLLKLQPNIVVATAYHNSQPVACGIFPFSHFSSYYQYGATVKSSVTGAMNLLHWEMIKYFKSHGVKTYDFVGARINPKRNSKIENIQKFKRNFGADLFYGKMWKVPITYKYFIYSALFKLKNKFKGDIIDQELGK